MLGGVSLEYLEAAHMYLFGGVKFLHLLLLLMALDILTGVVKAFKNGSLWSRKALFGYARKVMILVVIIVANVIDQVLALDGMVAYATVLFYLANEGLSIAENLAQIGVIVPDNLAEKLKHIESKSSRKFEDDIKEEFTSREDD